MFEAKLKEASVLKKIIEAIKDLVKSVNIDATSSGMSMQAMDSSHVALVSLQLNESGFKSYRCDRSITLGLSIENLSKILKCAGNDDVITIRAEDEPSTIKFTFENEKQDKLSEFNLNLINIDTEQLGIPETEYSSILTIPSQEFNRICKELQSLSESGIILITFKSTPLHIIYIFIYIFKLLTKIQIFIFLQIYIRLFFHLYSYSFYFINPNQFYTLLNFI